MNTIPIHDVSNVPSEPSTHYDAPYAHFIFASLVVGIGGGFLLSLLLPLARTLDWGWGGTQRWQVMAQLHGQLLLVGFGGLFVMGMALRISPRISTRQLALQPLVPTLIPLIVGYLLIRTAAQPLDDSAVRSIALTLSAALLVAGSAAFAAIIWSTLLSRESKAEAAGWFFTLGALGLLLSSLINAVQTAEMISEALPTAPVTRQIALVFTQQFGFLIMFIAGVGSRAVAGLTGQPRRRVAPRIAAVTYAAGVLAFATVMMIAADGRPGEATIRVGVLGLMLTGVGFSMFVWISGAFLPATRVAAASKLQFWFVRCAFAWMSFAAALIFWYGGEAVIDGTLPDQFALDGIRHVLTVGVLVNIIIGMAMLIVPEFAGRRLQHPGERWIIIFPLLAINIASALRLWPALEGGDWLEDSRYSPIVIASVLATSTIIAFATMFLQSWWEQRDPQWAQRATRPGG